MRSVDGVVLAAGLSTRTGCFKLALPLGEKTLLEHSILSMYDVVDRIIVVGGHNIEQVRDLVTGYAKAEVVYNAAFATGMFSSVRAGLRRVRARAFFLLPGDHPLVPPLVYRKLLSHPGDIVIPTFESRKGHPVLIASHLIAAIWKEPASSTLRDFIAKTGYVTVEVGERAVVQDVDDMQDYRNIKEAYERDHQ